MMKNPHQLTPMMSATLAVVLALVAIGSGVRLVTGTSSLPVLDVIALGMGGLVVGAHTTRAIMLKKRDALRSPFSER